MVTGLRRAGSSPAPGTLHIAARPSAARGQHPCDPGRPLLDHRSPAPWRSAPPGVRPPCHGDPTPVPHITPPWRRAPNPSPHIAAPPRRPRHRKGDEVKRYTPPSPTSSRSPRRGVAPVLSRRAALGLGLVVGGAAALPGSAALAAPEAGTSPPCAHSRARWNRASTAWISAGRCRSSSVATPTPQR